MEAAYMTALALVAGSAVAGLTSVFSSWRGDNAQLKAQLFLNDKDRKQELYRDFIEQASSLYIDALVKDKPDPSKTVALYALVSQMRVVSSPEVVAEANRIALRIAHTYPEPNKTIDDLLALMDGHGFDPLQSFSAFCREELQGKVLV